MAAPLTLVFDLDGTLVDTAPISWRQPTIASKRTGTRGSLLRRCAPPLVLEPAA